MMSRSPRQRPGKDFPVAKAVAVLLVLLVLQSGFLVGLPSVEALGAPDSTLPADSRQPAEENATPETPESTASFEAPPSLAADLSASGARQLWESPSRDLAESARSRNRARFTPVSAENAASCGRSAFRPPYDPAGGGDAFRASHRLLLQTAQLSAG